MLDKKFFIDVGPEVRDKYRKHIFKGAKDVNGRKFKSNYSSEYAKRKKAGGKGFIGGFPFNAPVASGQTLNDYSLIKTMSNGFQIGWTTFGARVQWLMDMGRVLTHPNQPLPTGVQSYLFKESEKYNGKGLIKIFGKNKTTKHKIGKK